MPEETAQCACQPTLQLRRFALAAVAVAVFFALPLWRLFVFALHDELFSYILLIPPTSVYLGWLLQKKLPAVSLPQKKWAGIFFAAGLAAAAGSFLRPGFTVSNSLVLPTLAFVLFLAAVGFLLLGGAIMRVLAFPFALLVFMIPFPDALRASIETGLQQGSAFCAGWMFTLSGTTVFQDGLQFQLPTITLQIAPECSGIHSSVVLLIVSLVAGHFFLRASWKRALLCLAVIPLALLRNGFRVFVLGELCTHIGPQMIDSPIHHHGGPLFFALSLIPFSLLLYYLMKSERPKISQLPPTSKN
jgi:exosortase C (VPDSG-CTERM-specific)